MIRAPPPPATTHGAGFPEPMDTMTTTTEITTIIYAAHCAEDTDSIPAAEWQRLASETETALRTAYPTAEVSVEIRHGVRGVGSGTTYRVNGEKDDIESADANAIAERAWERWCATMPSESADAS